MSKYLQTIWASFDLLEGNITSSFHCGADSFSQLSVTCMATK